MNKDLIHNIFEYQVGKSSDNIAIEEGAKKITYLDLNRQVNNLAHTLRELQVNKETVVATVLPSSINLVSSLLAIFKSGGIYLPLDLSFSIKRQTQIFSNTSCKIIITNRGLKAPLLALLKEIDVEIDHLIVFEENGFNLYNFIDNAYQLQNPFTHNFENLPTVSSGEDGCYLVYTSGSTGEGKAILGCHKGLTQFIQWETKEFQIDESIRVGQLSQITFDASLRDILLPLSNGGTLCIPPADIKSNIEQLINWLEEASIHLVHSVPSIFRLITKQLSHDRPNPVFKKLKYVFLAGEIIYSRDIQRWREKVGEHVDIINLYGTSETTMAKTFHVIRDIPEDPSKMIHVGKPIDNAFIAIINNNQLCRIGEIGEIYIKTSYMSKGYYKNSELTEQLFVQNPLIKDRKDIIYKTGDLGRYLKDRSVEVLGRLDDQVKINGIRVELKEVEKAVLQVEGINEVVVIAHKDEEGRNDLICYYTNPNISQEDIREQLKVYLNEAIIPSYFIYLEEFPLSINGKIDKKALPKPEALIINDEDYEEVQNEGERVLEGIWKEVLKIGRIGRKISFFKIGGTSLKAIQVISRIYNDFKVSIKISEFFSNPTIKQLDVLIANTKKEEFEKILPVDKQEYYDVSNGQKRLWLVNQFEGETNAYNLPAASIFEGDLNRDAFERSLYSIVDRHEILRTTFSVVHGVLKQKVNSLKASNFRVQFFDLRSNEKAEGTIGRIHTEAIETPFNLETGPLLRACLIQVEDKKYVFSFVMHHIISDNWSQKLLVNELLILYNAFNKGLENPLQPLGIQYRDYAAWQNAALKSDKLKQSEEYWLKQFKEEIPVLDLKPDHPKSLTKTNKGAKVRFNIDPILYSKISNLSKEQDCSLFMTLLASFNAFLFKYYGYKDIVVGAPTAGRYHTDLENQIGFYVNTLALRSSVDENESFVSLLKKVKDNVLLAYEHEIYPYNSLVEKLNIEGTRSNFPLFNIVVNMSTMSSKDMAPKMENITTKNYDLGFVKATGDLRIIFFQIDENIEVIFEYNTDLFVQSRMERMVQYFEVLLNSISNNGDQPVYKLNFITREEENRILLSSRNEDLTLLAQSERSSMIELFEEQVSKSPKATALQYNDIALTYEELNFKVNSLAHHLRTTYNIQPNEIVGLMVNRSERMIIGLLAILKAGGAYLPIDATLPTERKKYVSSDSNIKLLLTDSDFIFDIDFFKGQIFALDIELPLLEGKPKNLASISTSRDLGYVIYTSGSTGVPKGVMIEQRSNINMALDLIQKFGIKPEDKIVQFASLSFDASVAEIFMALYSGTTLVVIDEENINNIDGFISYLESKQVSVVIFPPTYLSVLDLERLNFLRVIITAGEPAHVKDITYCSSFANCFNAYGPSECSVCVSIYKVGTEDAKRERMPVGFPIANTQVFILDGNLQPVPIGVEGELYVAGVGLARGYLSEETLTKEKFLANPLKEGERIYKTGDRARWIDYGNIEFSGRKDGQVKIRGIRVELEEISAVLKKNELIQDSVITTKKDIDGNLLLVAYFISRLDVNVAELKEFVSKYLPDYLTPSYFIQLKQLPLTVNGKIDYKALPDPNVVNIRGNKLLKEASNEVERILVGIWKEVLSKESISVNENFFDLGGHSLKAIQMMSRIHKELDVKIKLNDIFTFSTIESLANVIATTNKTIFESITPLSETEYYELSHSQLRLWILDQIDKGGLAYLVPSAYVFEGDLNIKSFQKAFEALIERHEILRTSFLTVDGQPKQYINKHHSGFIEYIDLRHTTDKNRITEEYAAKELVTPFHLDEAPLLRAKLIHLEENKFAFLFTMHHIISDGWSMEIIIKEVMRLYSAYSKNLENSLPALRIQYKDYAFWQNRQLEGEANEYQKYWNDQFSGELPFLNFPTDSPRKEIKTYNGATSVFEIPSELTEQLKVFSKKEESTLFIFLLACVNVVLYKYTDQKDLIVGSTIAGREHQDTQDQIGFYLNTLALRTIISDNDNFVSLLSKVKTTVFNSYKYQLYPFNKLIEDLKLARVPGRSPLFDVLVEMINIGVEREEELNAFEDIKIKEFPLTSAISKFDLSFKFKDHGDKLFLILEYNTDLFKETTINRVCQNFTALIKLVIQEPGASIHDISLLSEKEKELLLEDFNGTDVPLPDNKTFSLLFEEIVNQCPHAPAIVFRGKSMSYKELNDAANQLGLCLRSKYHIKEDDILAVFMPRSEELIISMLGILKAGAAFLPIDSNYPQERVQYILADSKAKALIIDSSLMLEVSLFYKGNLFVVDIERQGIQQMSERLEPVNTSRSPAYAIYTSGSTGTPKGVKIQNHSFVNYLTWANEYYFENKSGNVFPFFTSVSFDLTLTSIYTTLLRGDAIHVYEDKEISAVLFDIFNEDTEVNTVKLTPSHVDLLEYLALEKTNVKSVILGGEQVLEKHIQILRKLNPTINIYNEYGPTETTIGCTVKKIGQTYKDEISSIGKPIQNLKIYIVDQQMNLLPIGAVGEICVGGVGVAQSYMGHSLISEKFFPNPFVEDKNERIYKTGDLGKWLLNGEIEYLGRKDNQVKINGNRIELGEIEGMLLQHPTVKKAAVLVKGEKEKQIIAYYVAKNEVSSQELKHYLRKSLPEFMIPGGWVSLDAIPLTINGKIDVTALNSLQETQIKLKYLAPRNTIETALISLWEQTLNRTEIGVADNFFELGGNSLKIIKLFNLLDNTFPNHGMEIGDLFDYATVMDQAIKIQKLAGTFESKPTFEVLEF
jgi:amino acid adenylation domain-containing protein